MLAGMKNIELHVMENNADVGDGLTAGLLETRDLDDPQCSACTSGVGHKDGTFYPYAVALDEDDQWMVCTECASPVIDPVPPVNEAAPAWESFVSDAND